MNVVIIITLALFLLLNVKTLPTFPYHVQKYTIDASSFVYVQDTLIESIRV